MDKEEGGLGLKDMVKWNTTLILRQIWQLLRPTPSSIWARWVHSVILKGQSFWVVITPTNYSWLLKKIFGLRPLALRYSKVIIGDGESTSLWF